MGLLDKQTFETLKLCAIFKPLLFSIKKTKPLKTPSKHKSLKPLIKMNLVSKIYILSITLGKIN